MVKSNDGLLGLGFGEGHSTASQIQGFSDLSDMGVADGAVSKKADEYEPEEKPEMVSLWVPKIN